MPAATPVLAPDPNQRVLHDLTERLNEMQRQLEALSKSSGRGDE